MSLEHLETMNIVIAGHVDHGKSTVIGRLLADTDSLPKGKLQSVRDNCERNSKPFEYAFLLDALKDEQAQGITIDSARVFFKSDKRHYIIIDAPGHIEFLKNMITGASRAEAALLVIDANEGVQENSRRHGYMMSMLGIKQMAVVVNKMDLVDYSEKVFKEIVSEYTEFLTGIGMEAACFLPVSGREGDNIASLSKNTPWYKSDTVLQVLDNFNKEKAAVDKPLRVPIQDVYKFTKFGDDRRMIAGTIDTGKINAGDSIVFYPSGKKATVKSIERFNAPARTENIAGEATSFTMEEQIYVKRGELAVKAGELQPEVTTRLNVSLFWLGRQPMVKKKEYLLKLGTAKIPARLEEIRGVIDASSLNSEQQKDQIDRHDVAECVIRLTKPIACDKAENIDKTSRFVIVDDYEIAGGGIVREGLDDAQSTARENVFERNYKWEASKIAQVQRATRFNQKAALILLTGKSDIGKKDLAKQLEAEFFNEGKIVYYLGIGNVVHGVGSDIKGENEGEIRAEHLRRFAEACHILLDAGLIVVVTANELSQSDLELVKTIVNPDDIETIWMGDDVTTDISYDMHIPTDAEHNESISKIRSELQELGIIFRPW